jgi:membrane fusion protein (multidrug efflux system)
LTQNYREGDSIKKGDLLFEIDPRPFKAALDQAQGLLAQAEAKLGKTELDVKRYGPLVKDKAISREEYDDAVQANLEAKAAVVSAKAQVERAQLNLEFTKITSPIDGIASIAKAQIGDLVGPATGEFELRYRQTILNLARTQRDQLLAVVPLYKTLGGRWPDELKSNQAQ